jgi:hypothetical protein
MVEDLGESSALEGAARRLRDHDIVRTRRHLRQYLPVPRPRREVDALSAMLGPAVAPVGGQRLDPGVDDRVIPRAEGRKQSRGIRQDVRTQPSEIVIACDIAELFRLPANVLAGGLGVAILQVDDEEGGSL